MTPQSSSPTPSPATSSAAQPPGVPGLYEARYDYLSDFSLGVRAQEARALRALAEGQPLSNQQVLALLATSAPQLLGFRTAIVPDAAAPSESGGNLPKEVVVVYTPRPVLFSIQDGKLKILVGKPEEVHRKGG